MFGNVLKNLLPIWFTIAMLSLPIEFAFPFISLKTEWATECIFMEAWKKMKFSTCLSVGTRLVLFQAPEGWLEPVDEFVDHGHVIIPYWIGMTSNSIVDWERKILIFFCANLKKECFKIKKFTSCLPVCSILVVECPEAWPKVVHELVHHGHVAVTNGVGMTSNGVVH